MKGCDKLVDVGRRQFLRGGVMATAGAAATTVLPTGQATAKPAPARVEYRRRAPSPIARPGRAHPASAVHATRHLHGAFFAGEHLGAVRTRSNDSGAV
jgi:hypothetical protein